MKAEVINAKAVKFTDGDGEKHTVLEKDIEECRIERESKSLKYFVGLTNIPCVFDVDHDTYNILFTAMKESVGVNSKNQKIKAQKNGSKEIAFKDTTGFEQTVLPKNIHGLTVKQYDGKLECFIKLFNEGYSSEVDFKTYNILLAALKSVANAKEKDNGKK